MKCWASQYVVGAGVCVCVCVCVHPCTPPQRRSSCRWSHTRVLVVSCTPSLFPQISCPMGAFEPPMHGIAPQYSHQCTMKVPASVNQHNTVVLIRIPPSFPCPHAAPPPPHQVLEGVQLVFSRVIPLETNPRQHPLWLLAEQYGATCTEQCTDDTTHVVAMTGGTEKVGVCGGGRTGAEGQLLS